jgi:hypothetical protein
LDNPSLKSRVAIRKYSTRDGAAFALPVLETGPQVKIVEKSVKCGITSRDETDFLESLQNPDLIQAYFFDGAIETTPIEDQLSADKCPNHSSEDASGIERQNASYDGIL